MGNDSERTRGRGKGKLGEMLIGESGLASAACGGGGDGRRGKEWL